MPAVLTTVGSLVVMLFAMNLAILNPVTAVVGIFLYGAAAFSVVAPLQLRIVTKAADAPDVASAAIISAFTVGSALGIWLGGLAIDGGLGIASVNWVGGLISLSGLALALVTWLWVDRRYPYSSHGDAHHGDVHAGRSLPPTVWQPTKEGAMRFPSGKLSRARHLVCPFCESGELVSVGPGFARCDSCGLPLLGSMLEALRDLVGLPDAVGAHPCECGHPEMRRLPGGVFYCPACRSEVLPV